MHKQLMEWSKDLLECQIPRWEDLPTFDLYSDQVIQLINEYLGIYFEDEETIITAAMINNYVKHKMMPKPEKKKYQRVHLAYLIAITMLKQVLTIEQVNAGITYQAQVSGLKGAYNLFCEEMERSLHNVALQIHSRFNEADGEVSKQAQAMYFASNSFACKVVANKIISINKEKENSDEPK